MASARLENLFELFFDEIRSNTPTFTVVDTTTVGVFDDIDRFHWNPTGFTNKKAADLGKALVNNTTVVELIMDISELTPSEGLKPLTDYLGSSSRLRKVALAGNTDHTSIVDSLLGALKRNSHLQELSLGLTDRPDSAQSFARLLIETSSLKKLCVRGRAGTQCEAVHSFIVNGLSQNKTLESVSIDLHESALEPFLRGLQHHSSLKNLQLLSVDNVAAFETFLQTNTGVSCLDICCGRFLLTAPMVEALQRNTSIQELVITSCNSDNARLSAQVLRSNTSITKLTLKKVLTSENNDGFAEIAATLAARKTPISHLSLPGIEGKYGAAIASRVLRTNRSLKSFNLSHNHYGNGAATILATGLSQNRVPEEIDLSDCDLSDQDMVAIAGSLIPNSQLKSLRLVGNADIGPAGVQSLVDRLLVHLNITSLNLSQTRIGDKGANSLALLLLNNATPLTHLAVDSAEIGDDGLVSLVSALETNTVLEAFSAKGNEFTDQGFKALANRLPLVKGLKKIDMSWDKVGKETMLLVGKGLDRNRSLLVAGILDQSMFRKLPIIQKLGRNFLHRVAFFQSRNHYTSLLDAPEGTVPEGVWQYAIERAVKREQPSVVCYVLREKLTFLLKGRY